MARRTRDDILRSLQRWLSLHGPATDEQAVLAFVDDGVVRLMTITELVSIDEKEGTSLVSFIGRLHARHGAGLPVLVGHDIGCGLVEINGYVLTPDVGEVATNAPGGAC